jgi:CheY-like chemotaxis protein/anti-sigma regulatory factor (Ser/Thr protein kinase)
MMAASSVPEAPDGRRGDAPRAHSLLLVDDSPVDQHRIGDLVARHLGWEIHVAPDADEALLLLRGRPVDLVLTDVVMPGRDGLDLLRAIRTEFPHVPVVLMTAFGSEELAIKALREGAANYVPKRTLPRDLVRALTEVADALRAGAHQQRLLGCLQGVDKRFDLANDPALVPPLVSHLQEFFSPLELGDDNARLRVGIALEEALLNGMYHGNLEVSSELREGDGVSYYELAERRRRVPPYRDRRLHLDAQLSREAARFVVRDEGPGFDTASLPDPTDPANLEKCSGRGLLLIHTFMDEVRYNDAGNQITMVKRRDPSRS